MGFPGATLLHGICIAEGWMSFVLRGKSRGGVGCDGAHPTTAHPPLGGFGSRWCSPNCPLSSIRILFSHFQVISAVSRLSFHSIAQTKGIR